MLVWVVWGFRVFCYFWVLCLGWCVGRCEIVCSVVVGGGKEGVVVIFVFGVFMV